LEARARLLVTIAIHFLLRLAHNFSFGVDFMLFATQNNGTFYCLSPLQLFLLAMVYSNSPLLS
jgi:hypothetical protein